MISQSTQPHLPIQSSLPPYQTQSHNAHSPSTTGHETSNVPDAACTKFNISKSHEQHVAHAAWSEDLLSNATLPVKLSSPISPNCMFSFLFNEHCTLIC